MSGVIEVAASAGTYTVEVGRGCSRRWREHVPETILVVCDENTRGMADGLLGDRSGAVFAVPPGETSKTLDWAGAALAAGLEAGLDRNGTIIAVGGGVVGDLAGLVAAMYMRGIRLVQVPTTLLAQVDSAIGGKAAVNLPGAKNVAGAFKSPAAVLVDPDLLTSLPEREFRSGMAEVIKYALIADDRLFDILLRDRAAILGRDLDLLTTVIHRCCAIKAGVVSRDEFEAGERAILNYGHTFGHALEAATGYSTFTHGEAISVGMVVAGRLGRAAGVTPPEVVPRQEEVLEGYDLPTRAPGAAQVAQVLRHLGHDKKVSEGTVRWVLLEALGRATPGHRLDPEGVDAAISWALGEAA